MIDYILEVEFAPDHKKYYHDIVSIDFYKNTIRAKDTNEIVIHIPRQNIETLRIHPVDTRRTEE